MRAPTLKSRENFHLTEKNTAAPSSLILFLYCGRSELNNAEDVLHSKANSPRNDTIVETCEDTFVSACHYSCV